MWLISNKNVSVLYNTMASTRRVLFVPALGGGGPVTRRSGAQVSHTSRRGVIIWNKALGGEGGRETGDVEETENPSSKGAAIIEKSEIADEMAKSYMSYAMSVILGRALPDIRDGLKPVHRRILYAMHEMHVRADGPYRKSARVVGEVLGKYHPHGDSSVYDALVRMAQPFSMTIPLIDGHGNFGSVDGDAPAAMRYTECRLSKFSEKALLEDLQYDTVDFGPNFDASVEEPLVMPAKLPNLLVGGSQGIAVGLATKIPPYNVLEVAEAVLLLLNDPNVPSAEVLKLMPAPDFPTGGKIIGLEGAQELFMTGKGRIMLRATTHFEKITGRSGKTKDAIIITELPYQLNKSRLVQSIADLVNQKAVEGISDLRDESDREGMRIVIELGRQGHPNVVLNNLFKRTYLQTSFSAHIVALDDGKMPQRFTVRQCLEKFIQFRTSIIRKRCGFQLKKAEARNHLVLGYLSILKDTDGAVDLIRTSETIDAAKQGLMNPNGKFKLTEIQADAVLSLQLRRLTRLESSNLERENRELEARVEDLVDTLRDDKRIVKILQKEMKEIMKLQASNGARRSEILTDNEVVDDDRQLIPNGRSVLLMTDQGYVKRMPIENFNIQRRGGRGSSGVGNMREEDRVSQFFICRDHDIVVIVTKDGVVYKLFVYKVPVSPRQSRGTPVAKLIPSINSPIAEMMVINDSYSKDQNLLFVTKQCVVKKASLDMISRVQSTGSVIMNVLPGDEIKAMRVCKSTDSVFLCSKRGMGLRTSLDDGQFVPRAGRRTGGVRGMKQRNGDELIDAVIVPSDDVKILIVLSSGVGKVMNASQFRTARRGGIGVKAANAKPDEEVVAAKRIEEDDQVMLVTEMGQVVRVSANELGLTSRTARGVILQKTDSPVIGVDLVNQRILEEQGEDVTFENGEEESDDEDEEDEVTSS